MRVNVYAEEMTDRIEIISKEIDGHNFTGLRIYLELPCTIPLPGAPGRDGKPLMHNVKGPFIHRPGDDDSSAVTFWGKQDLREVLKKALVMLDEHYGDGGDRILTKELANLPVTLPHIFQYAWSWIAEMQGEEAAQADGGLRAVAMLLWPTKWKEAMKEGHAP